MQTPFVPSPRSIPFPLRASLLFGGFRNQVGWFLLGFGLIFVWVFGGNLVLRDLAYFSGSPAVAEATVTAVKETGVRVNKVPIHAYHYRYRFEGMDYRGREDYFRDRFRPGDRVVVEISPGNPAHSRLQGLDDGRWGAALAAFFPAVGLVFIVLGLRLGLRGIRLLGQGRVAQGELVDRTDTRARINRQAVYRFRFRFQAADGSSHIATATSHDSDRLLALSGRPGEGRPVLYDPGNPAAALLPDALPGAPAISPAGQVTGAGSAASLVLPALTILGHGAWALHVLELL